jgi:FkbM family methyltransferase
MKLYSNYYWPDADQRTAEAVMREVALLPSYLKHCKSKRTCIQAGGNVGVYAQELSRSFDLVITIEPDPDNWACLTKNVVSPNIVAHHAAIGDTRGRVSTFRQPHEEANYGATMVQASEIGVPVKVVDDAGLGELDFLLLDVEGYELPAVRGAVETIKRCRPVIAVEVKGLGSQFGYTNDALKSFVEAQGYHIADRIGRDIIFTPIP